jgi:hypothetical protein
MKERESSMGDDRTPHEVTIRGIVIPTDWDSRGEVLRVAILAPDEDQYDVADSRLGSRLLGALREEVEACVRVDQAHRGRQRVTILSFEVVDEDHDDYVLEDLLNEPDRGDW